MTNEELQEELSEIKRRLGQVEEFITVTYRQKLRLDSALQGEKTYYVVPGATGPTGASSKKLVFKDGILTTET